MSLLLSSTLPVTRHIFSRARVLDRPSSSPSSSSSSTSTTTASSSSSSPISISCSFSARFSPRRCSCALYYSSKARVMAESAEVVNSSSGEEVEKDVTHSRTFLDVRSEEELLSGIKKETEAGRLPSNFASVMEELYRSYQDAVFQSGIPDADEIILSNTTALFDRVLLDAEDSFVFPPHHKAMREPFDYYMFGQNYIRPLIDFGNSYVGNINIFHEMEEKLQQGHNIILISNHQTEADPAIIALLLEKTNPHISENVTYVAGDRVLTDILCKPFSMGRNLMCVYSKKHMLDDPKLAEMKKKANIRSLKEMAMLLRGGSQIVWIAPSGGRDRPDPQTGEWHPAPFDASSVDNMRRLAENAGVPAHIYPLALICYNIMPPPPKVEKEIGEKRVVSFHGVGLSVIPDISYAEIAAACENSEEVKEAYSKALHDSVTEQYNVLKSAIHGKQGLEASIPDVSLSQPWQ
ncbi:glycerol-3-phosphate acyltransferase, chloroplastic isoform X1 [Malania oleifera]|uniref:glycerol-3-phosphate acyltransferase, chloroplastic isoform X1 n=1 Tax=Malania oleifera TaxID=397392 RepID=UPI0025AE7361|nr:glycerol-3-phosphate acyltransferase, chloroplastic isoform X1 [Malania oleifera]XP_057977178.1 glycerol-3-phosphate acyltransferase, chloroplastic isoform X1 [Malania oleifera]XP_057977179.1 glycerol-3-phosphate acyltransferase, chloroplastic isoform X1 [Malania oleifera]XP_057977180.1 glycerol-3-phosphate acyltransferase, chloroplastic isoform X1 [Malania oleifera]XP_057977181.1 glycerol-3-phosphate acyltransferase, chloroplastic isoform X1 [Malania oleifera]